MQIEFLPILIIVIMLGLSFFVPEETINKIGRSKLTFLFMLPILISVLVVILVFT